MKTEKDKMLAGELYNPGLDPQLRLDEAAAKAWMARYNAMMDTKAGERHVLLTEHFKSVGKGAVEGVEVRRRGCLCDDGCEGEQCRGAAGSRSEVTHDGACEK